MREGEDITIGKEEQRTLAFFVLLGQYTAETAGAWAELIRLQQVHYLKCQHFFKSIDKQMRRNYQLSKQFLARQQELEAAEDREED